MTLWSLDELTVARNPQLPIVRHEGAPAWGPVEFGETVDLDLMTLQTRQGPLNVSSSFRLRLQPDWKAVDGLTVGRRSEFGDNLNARSPNRASEADLSVGHGVVVRVQRASPLKQTPRVFDWSDPAFSFFAAADSDALAWRLDRAANGDDKHLYYQSDRVQIGDIEAGFALEAGRARLGLAYVEREIHAPNLPGVDGQSRDEQFVGVTLTLK